jgi:hypothetical protein
MSYAHVRYHMVDEDRTLLPVLHKRMSRRQRASFIKRLILRTLRSASNDSVVIFDRLIFTHALLASSTRRPFRDIEHLLMPYHPHIILLLISSANIPGPIRWAIRHRDKKWMEHVRQKGNMQQIVSYYRAQQRSLRSLSRLSAIPVEYIDTDTLSFRRIAQGIFAMLLAERNVTHPQSTRNKA